VAERIQLLEPKRIKANPENPRLIFHGDELAELQDSIKQQGILVPLTVYEDGARYVLLDGERRWRCATKLGLAAVPAIVQPKPDRLQNIMMMFAIHNTRRDWDPLPTALKLEELEQEFSRRHGTMPTEKQLAGLASIERGEVRRLRNLLRLPRQYRDQLLQELAKPRSEQRLTVDHVLESIRGAGALRKREVIDAATEDKLRRALIKKFRAGTLTSTVEPRKLARIARAVERGEVKKSTALRVTTRLINEPSYTVNNAFEQSVEQIDFEHGSEQLAERLVTRLAEHGERGYEASAAFRATLRALRKQIDAVLKS
jgi:ParB family transcriptional regulator, chromosome partitioning protein